MNQAFILGPLFVSTNSIPGVFVTVGVGQRQDVDVEVVEVGRVHRIVLEQLLDLVCGHSVGDPFSGMDV